MTLIESEKKISRLSRDEAHVFYIAGMSCFSCVRKIESIVSSIPGVKKVAVDLSNGQAVVWYDLSVKENDVITLIEKAGYTVTGTAIVDKGNIQQQQNIFLSSPFPYIKGLFAALGIIGFYLGLLTLISDWYYAAVQFESFRIWILLLAAGLGIQVFLYSILRLHIKSMQIKGAGKTIVVSGGLSTAGMAACCAHYLVTVLPVLGVPFVSSAIASLEQYQTVFFFIGVLSNIFGILFMLNLMRKNRMLAVPGFLQTTGADPGQA